MGARLIELVSEWWNGRELKEIRAIDEIGRKKNDGFGRTIFDGTPVPRFLRIATR